MDPFLEKCMAVFVCEILDLSGSRWTVNASTLAGHRTSRAESLVQYVDILNLAFDVPKFVAVILSKCCSLVKDRLEIASAVNDDMETLLHEILS